MPTLHGSCASLFEFRDRRSDIRSLCTVPAAAAAPRTPAAARLRTAPLLVSNPVGRSLPLPSHRRVAGRSCKAMQVIPSLDAITLLPARAALCSGPIPHTHVPAASLLRRQQLHPFVLQLRCAQHCLPEVGSLEPCHLLLICACGNMPDLAHRGKAGVCCRARALLRGIPVRHVARESDIVASHIVLRSGSACSAWAGVCRSAGGCVVCLQSPLTACPGAAADEFSAAIHGHCHDRSHQNCLRLGAKAHAKAEASGSVCFQSPTPPPPFSSQMGPTYVVGAPMGYYSAGPSIFTILGFVLFAVVRFSYSPSPFTTTCLNQRGLPRSTSARITAFCRARFRLMRALNEATMCLLGRTGITALWLTHSSPPGLTSQVAFSLLTNFMGAASSSEGIVMGSGERVVVAKLQARLDSGPVAPPQLPILRRLQTCPSLTVWSVTPCGHTQVGLLGIARSLQKDLEKMADRADTSTPEGLHYVLQETVLSLLRHPDYCVYGSASSKSTDLDSAEELFNEMSMDERSKLGGETLVNSGGVKKTAARGGPASDMTNEYIVVTVIVAAEGNVKLPQINNLEDLKTALKRLGSVRADGIQAVEVLWTPQQDGDTLTQQELLRDYPLLNNL